jgi:DNA invertase Pin-like site-specific DNA recombinase
MLTPAFAYLRVSHANQTLGDGYDRQIAAISSYASQNDLEIVQIFREEVSGTRETTDRPAWVQMMSEILVSGVKTVLVERLDRLARDLMVQEHIIADVRSRSLTLISAYEPDLCQDDPTRKLMRQIMGAIAEYDKSMIVLKLRGARQRMKQRAGKCEGQKSYGHYPGESETLDQIRSLHAKGMRSSHIASVLNNLGLKSRRGTQWYPAVVARIVRAS